MFIDDLAQRLIREALLMKPEFLRSVDAGQDSRLPGSALRAAFDTETGIRPRQRSAKQYLGLLILKYGERRDVRNLRQRIVFVSPADPESVDEDE